MQVETVFIAYGQTTIGKRLINNYLEAGYKVIISVTELQEDINKHDNLIGIPWTPSSIFSTKTLVRNMNRYNPIDTFIFPYGTSKPGIALDALSNTQIQKQLDENYLSILYLLREILDNETKQSVGDKIARNGKPTLAFILQRVAYKLEALELSLEYAFEGLVNSILQSASLSVFNNYAFQSKSQDIDGFCRNIIKSLELANKKKIGNWQQYNEKRKLLSVK